MNDTTRETLRTLGELLRAGANRRLDANPHDAEAYTMHALSNEIAIALALPADSATSITDNHYIPAERIKKFRNED